MAQKKEASLLDKIMALAKRRGFIFPTSEIYGGLNGFWDYGPLGASMKRNIRELWWRDIVRDGQIGPDGNRFDVVGIDASIIMNPETWRASGHIDSFSDPMVDCRKCNGRWRADQLPETKCIKGGDHDMTEPREFNLMFKTHVGPVEDSSSVSYLRPETAQAIFSQFTNVINSSRGKVPFGIAQIGKAFRNEINPRHYTFRSREFEQMELEFFIKPGTDDEWFSYWVNRRVEWYKSIGLPDSVLSLHVDAEKDLAHYASACTDIMFDFTFGADELEGIAARNDYDLKQHSSFSKKSLDYFDPEMKARYIPHVIEPSAGVDRITLALLSNAYHEEKVEGKGGREETRVVLKLHPRIAPVTVAVFPLLRNNPDLVAKADEVFKSLSPHFTVQWDDRGNIGKRYRYQDEMGTPYCVTVDFDTLGKEEDPGLVDTVTLRDRDTMLQQRVPISALAGAIRDGMER